MNKSAKAQAATNIVACKVQIGVDDHGKPILRHGSGFVPLTLRQLARVRCGFDKFFSKFQFSCGHYHDVRLVR